MLSAIKCGWNCRNSGARIDGRSILHTPSILRTLKAFWYYSEYRSTRSASTRITNRTKYCQYSKYSRSPPQGNLLQRPSVGPSVNSEWMLSAITCGWNYRNGGAQIDVRYILHTPSILRILKVLRVLAVLAVPVLAVLTGRNTASTWQYPHADPWYNWSTAVFHMQSTVQ